MSRATAAPVDQQELVRLVAGEHRDPHSVLGPHEYDGGVTVRVLRPLAEDVTVVYEGGRVELAHEAEGVFTGVLPTDKVPDYRLDVVYGGTTYPTDDPYRFLPTLGPTDLHLIGEGRHERLWDVLGAHVRTFDTPWGPVTGTSFAVWAPNARGARVAGEFNNWDSRAHPMRVLDGGGVWELFVPGVGHRTRYKFDILGVDGEWRLKADPMAFATETPPDTASMVFQSTYHWDDELWMERRPLEEPHRRPGSIYEVHLGSWRQGLSYELMASELVGYVTDMGFTHVEFLPVSEHPYGGSWGYQVSSYYAPTARFGDPDGFRLLVDRLHQAGIGVIVDWVPAHFPKDEWSLVEFDGAPLYEHADPRRGEHPDWGTLVFDFGRPQVRNFLVANALYWLEEFHIDGIRVDAVASMLYLDYSRQPGEWEPNIYGGRENLEAVQFVQEMNATVYKHFHGAITVAEESTAWPGVTRATHLGGLGFGFKWNMGWMHDTLGYLRQDPMYRHYHHHQMTFSLMYAYSENFVLPLSHDEVVHGKGSLVNKMPGDKERRLATLRAYLAFMWAHPGKQLLFMGGEIAQEHEWADHRSLDWWLLDEATHGPGHAGVQKLVRDLNRIYRATPELWQRDHDPTGFQWIDANDADGNVLSFLRYGDDGGVLACVANFSGVAHHDYRIGLPYSGRWREVLNTDATDYAGHGEGNLGAVVATEWASHGLPASATLLAPSLSTVWLRYGG